jgi:hypothetical protein
MCCTCLIHPEVIALNNTCRWHKLLRSSLCTVLLLLLFCSGRNNLHITFPSNIHNLRSFLRVQDQASCWISATGGSFWECNLTRRPRWLHLTTRLLTTATVWIILPWRRKHEDCCADIYPLCLRSSPVVKQFKPEGQWTINRGEKEEEWMAATSMNAANPSTMFIHTNPLSIIRSFLDRYNPPASLYCSPFWKPWDLLTWLQQIPRYISDQWGQITGRGERTIDGPVRFLTSWMKYILSSRTIIVASILSLSKKDLWKLNTKFPCYATYAHLRYA